MREWLTKHGNALAGNLLLAASVIGLGYGCYQAWEPLGWIVPCLLVIGGMTWNNLTRPEADE